MNCATIAGYRIAGLISRKQKDLAIELIEAEMRRPPRGFPRGRATRGQRNLGAERREGAA